MPKKISGTLLLFIFMTSNLSFASFANTTAIDSNSKPKESENIPIEKITSTKDAKTIKATTSKDSTGKTILKCSTGINTLAISRSDVQNCQSKVGDTFDAKLVEDVKIGETIILPTSSILKGKITNIAYPNRFPCRDGSVSIAMNEIELPDGKKIDLSDKKINITIYSPFRKTFQQRIIRRAPMQICSYAIMLPLTAARMAGTTVYAIAMGGSIAAGAATGYLLPAKGVSRTQSAMDGCIEATPIGTAKLVMNKGENADIKTGDGVQVTFDTKTINKILKEMNINAEMVQEQKASLFPKLF